ncbi:hypothetical protein AVEN_46774-1 [Araneus ventricosus]|uniref:Uncharacterized protein n=1 Tax=Araneus ventricosus TaxID=182803 RepID=A0A4Y2VA92_ARAVE|nr:hypothetical protein AVEN_46774-1 [Araneus ventricosus]
MLFNVSQCYGASFIVGDVRPLPRDRSEEAEFKESDETKVFYISTNNKEECTCVCVGDLQAKPLDLELQQVARTYFGGRECASKSLF